MYKALSEIPLSVVMEFLFVFPYVSGTLSQDLLELLVSVVDIWINLTR